MINYRYITGQTPLEESEKQGLIPSIINRADLDNWEQENILKARAWLMQKSRLARADIFTEKFLLELHKKMFSHVWKWAGTYRKTNKNIGVEFYKIPSELKTLLEDAKYWQENKTYSPPNIAIIFHHRLVKIHLFSNGNGRHARMVADAIIAKNNETPLNWGRNLLLTEPTKTRKKYISALRLADIGNYDDLLKFAKNQN